ncbi:MAG: aspartate/glutamate racemase family protein [Alphaproteobacteria bacterium]
MKTVGIIGGLSPESTMVYYQGICHGVRHHLGHNHSGKILLNSLDFGEFVALKEQGDWATQERLLCDAARTLENAGADFIVLATNTMHKMAGAIEAAVHIPFLHLADATARRILDKDMQKVGLLGTRYTMEQDFYKERLVRQGIEVIVPDMSGIDDVNRIIYDELCQAVIKPESRARYVEVVSDFEAQGAQGVVLGCTEITTLISPSDINITGFDTTHIHIQDTLGFMFKETG